LALNYKALAYETQWLEYPDIEPTFKTLGIAPNAPGKASTAYSIPAVRMPDGRYIMESMSIAEALEALQPSPSLQLASPLLPPTQDAVKRVVEALAPIAKPRVPEMILNPGSVEYFERTRSKRHGMSLQDLARSELAGEAAWTAASEGLMQLQRLLAENMAGPYIMGADSGFADFVLAGMWRFVQLLDRDSDLFGRLIGYDENFARHFAACDKWLQRDD
jgi:glutathione S-transferase